jgi:hypothetical protein
MGESKKEKDSTKYENLKYGSIILLVLDAGETEKKLTTKLRVSDKVMADDEMGKDQYNVNCLFRIIPSSQYTMQDKIIDIVEEDTVPASINIEYENFISEINSNTNTYNLKFGKSVRFEDRFQLYQDSSKRFL